MKALPTFFPVAFSASMMETVYRCQTMFFREYIQHMTHRGKSPDLIAGSHVAKACEIVRTSYFTKGLSEEESIDLGVSYILDAEETTDSIKTNENVAYCLEKYFKKFRLSESMPPCALADGTHAVEYRFEFDLGIPHPDIPGRNITFVGRLDYLGEKVTIHSTTRHGLDEKTCKQVYRLKDSKVIDYAKEMAKYKTNMQILSYSFAARQLGVPLKSFFIRRIPIMSTFEESFELEIPVDNYAIDNWYESTRRLIADLVDKYKVYKEVYAERNLSPHALFYPTNSELACLSYSSPCRYMDGCVNKDGEGFLIEKYEQNIYCREKRIVVPLQVYLEDLSDIK
jgi:hypothetical protein